MTVNRTASAGRDYAENSDLCDIRVEPGPAGRPRHGPKRPRACCRCRGRCPAAAPDQPRQPTDNEIVVTGTLIKGIAPVGTNVVGVSHADIASSGATTALGVMATVPEISNAFNALPTPGTGLSGGTSVRPTIRNISAAGGAATLLLLNGHNMVGVGILQTAPDINIIPAGMLERVDVVADGGSALYGSTPSRAPST